ncbi:MAG: TetR/AcrR family transcriptional regulator [Actinomycetes bacterium]
MATKQPAQRQQGAATRTRLLEAGMQVLAERGYHAARVDDVVSLAQVSHGSFYLYFPNKEALVLELARSCAEELGAMTKALGEISADAAGRQALRDWLTEFLAIYRSYGVVVRAWVENQFNNPELTQLGLDSFASIAESLTERMSRSHPEDGPLRVVALVSMMERFTSLIVTQDLGDDDLVLDTAATVIHRGFFAGVPA